jgi:hypothetical protein
MDKQGLICYKGEAVFQVLMVFRAQKGRGAYEILKSRKNLPKF